MVNFCAVCGCCAQTDIVREHLEDTLRICDVSAMDLFIILLPLFAKELPAEEQGRRYRGGVGGWNTPPLVTNSANR
jgi:hypothetical protein